MAQERERSPYWASPYAAGDGVDGAPMREMRFEQYFGIVLADPMATCTGCGQVVMYREAHGPQRIVVANACRCAEATI